MEDQSNKVFSSTSNQDNLLQNRGDLTNDFDDLICNKFKRILQNI